MTATVVTTSAALSKKKQWVFSGRLVFGEHKFSADWFSGREKFSGDMCFVVRGVSEENLFGF